MTPGCEIKLKGRSLVFNESFLISEDEEAEIRAVVENGIAAFRLIFKPPTEGSKTRIEWHPEPDCLKIQCIGLGNGQGGMSEPAQITEINGKPLSFQLSAAKYGSKHYLVHFQLLLGGAQ